MAGLRIGGLASGMDIDGIVSQLMTAERMPLDKIEQKKIYTEWQRDDYRTMNTAIKEFRYSLAPDKGGVGSQAAFIKKTVTVSNNNVLSVENINSTNNFSGTINKVTQLAKVATMVSAGNTGDIKDKDGNKITSETTMATLLGIADDATQPLSIKAINADGGLDEKKVEIASKDTLEDVINKINNNTGVTVFFDEQSQKFSITAKSTGVPKDNQASIQLTGGFFNKILNLSTSTLTSATVGTDGEAHEDVNGNSSGQNVMLTYNGLGIERTSNNFIINGARPTVKETTETPVTYSSTPDVDAIFEKIKEFVDTYNGLISNISEEISQKKNKSYDPLTKAEKEALSEDEIEKWDKIARDGTLYRDPNLSSLLTNMRTSIYTSVKGTNFDNMAKIGIATTSNYLDGGKLEIDETKLREAINEDPNGIYELFMGGKDNSPASEQGLVRRLRSDLYTAMEAITEKAGKTTQLIIHLH